MNMLLWLMIRLYARMLRFYPAHFRDAFAEEMTAVFIEALSAIEQKGWLSLLIWCGREFTSLVTAIMREQWHSLRQEKAVMNPILPANYVHDADVARAETPLAIIAGIFPFILFGLMFTLKEVDYHMPLHWLIHGFVGDRIVHIILLVGLGIGWALRFPRWSYAYLGVVVMTSSWLAVTATPGFHLFGYTFGREQWGWRAWVPLLVLTAIMLLFTRSLQPLAQLFQGIRRDWTRLSFALYAALTWLMLGITYDGKTWYNQTFYLPLNLLLLTLVMTGGAILYMRGRRQWPRVLALQAALILYPPVSALVAAMDGHTEFGTPSTTVGWFTFFLIWLMWLSPPILPGLARHTWRRFRLI